jgi:hypothetical protein
LLGDVLEYDLYYFITLHTLKSRNISWNIYSILQFYLVRVDCINIKHFRELLGRHPCITSSSPIIGPRVRFSLLFWESLKFGLFSLPLPPTLYAEEPEETLVPACMSTIWYIYCGCHHVAEGSREERIDENWSNENLACSLLIVTF